MSLDINLYAEFLLNVRSVTVCASIRKESNVYKEAYVHADQKSVTISYDGTSSTIVLPLDLKLKGSVGFPVSDPAEISVRLEIIEEGLTPHGLHMVVVNDNPWTASELTPYTQIACRYCSTLIVASKQRIWKDLPRGSWTDMFDQWYCHRPSKSHEPNQQYLGAANPQVEQGMAFVDTCHFIFPKNECIQLQVS